MDENPKIQEEPTQSPSLMLKTNRLAIASVVCSLICFGPLGVVLSIVSIFQIERHKNEQKGMWLAVAGLALGVITSFLLITYQIPAFVRRRDDIWTLSCMSNVEQLEVTAAMYASDHGDRFPAAANWNEALNRYNKQPKILVCPADKTGGPSYAINSQLAGLSSKGAGTSAQTVLIFESEPGKNRAGGPEILPAKPRHSAGNTFGFVDGHVQVVAVHKTSLLNWNP